MKRIVLFSVVALAAAVFAGSPRALTVERVEEPCGVDVARPRFGWVLPNGVKAQTAYEIEADGWKSGRVESADHIDIPWNGAALPSSKNVRWRVRVWDENGEPSDWSFWSRFVTGLMRPSDWTAQWIGARVGAWTLSPSFVRKFAVKGEVSAAVLQVTGLGFYEATINGAKVGRKVLDPAPTDYCRRVLYSTYEVRRMLRPGENEIRLDLGHGWYDVRTKSASWNFDTAPWRSRPKAIAQLEVTYADGRKETIGTDETWEQVEGPVAYDDIREGVVIGPRRIHACPIPAGTKAQRVPPPKGAVLESETMPGTEIIRCFAPQEIRTLPDGRIAVTFPETVSGWARLTVRGLAKDDEITVRYDENPAEEPRLIDMYFLTGRGSENTGCSASAMQCDHFISSGAAVETFEPHFVWHGFRHLVISGLRTPPAYDDIRAVSVMTAIPEAGSFACSDWTLTRLVKLALGSYRLNYTAGYPTDCPHREKLGWTGDGWIASEMGQRYFTGTRAYEKWLQDVIDTQRETGELSCIAPTSGYGYFWGNGPVFDAVIGMLPWNLWTYGADRRAIDLAYGPLTRYLDFERRTYELEPDLVANGLGDWKSCAKEPASEEYVISCIYLRLREIAAEMAAVKGLADESAAFAAAAKRTRAALKAKYAKGNGVFDNGGQCAQALAIVFGLAADEERAAAGERLVEACEKTDCHIDFGLVGSKFVYRALAAVGRHDIVHRMLTNPTEPSMTKWLDGNGCLWEDFGDGLSKCHVMLGDFAAWCQQEIAGISPAAPGWAKIRIEPKVFGGITWARGAVETPYGRLESRWTAEKDGFELKVTVPPGTTAEVVLPGEDAVTVGPGEHRLATGSLKTPTAPYDYKELVTTATHPVEVREGLFDFGKDGIGWLELHGMPKGGYELVLGEMTNAEGHVANPFPATTIRCIRTSGTVEGDVSRVPIPAEWLNLTGWDPKAPAVQLPAKFGLATAFRFVEILKAPGRTRPENLVRQMIHYPIDMNQSSFACDNAVLNGVYDLCKHSILATSFAGVYVDGDRERTPYEADALINQLDEYAVWNDYSLARKSHEWLMDYPTWPTEWHQQSVMIAWADWMWSGDTRSLAKYYDQLKDEKLNAWYATRPDGLLVTSGDQTRGPRDIVDWPEGERDGFELKAVNAVVNAFRQLNLRQMSDIARALGKAADADAFAAEAKRHRAAFRRTFLDRGTGLFVDGEGSRHSSLHANAAALACGLVDADEMPRIVEFLDAKGMACSVYFAQFLLDAYCAAGRGDLAVKYMSATGKRSWKAMIDLGSTISMEAWHPDYKDNLDLNHPWGAVPLNVISRHVLGVTPAEPGFARVLIRPQVGSLRTVKGTVPTARGPVRIDATPERLVVETPAPATVVWKGETHDVKAGRWTFGVDK